MNQDDNISMMAERLQEFCSTDGEEHLGEGLLHRMQDPLKPRNRSGTFRFNPILILLMSIAILAVATFLFFSLVQP